MKRGLPPSKRPGYPGPKSKGPFAKLDGNNLVWDAFRRQVDSGRINLTDLWRAKDRKPGWSPRQWKRIAPGCADDIEFIGDDPDDPAWCDEGTAMMYMGFIDPQIMSVQHQSHRVTFS